MLLVKRTGEAAKSSKTTPTERSKIILTSSFFTLFFFFLKPYLHITTRKKSRFVPFFFKKIIISTTCLMAVLSSVPASCVGSHRFLITKGTSFYQSFAWILESPRLVPSVLLIPPRGNPRILSRIMPHWYAPNQSTGLSAFIPSN